MCAETRGINEIPFETAQAAKQLYNAHHIYLQIGDNLDTILGEVDFKLMDSTSRMDYSNLFRLAMAVTFEMAEGLADPQAAQNTLERLDWKYALYLPPRHPGYSEMDLCSFRRGLFETSRGMDEFGALLRELKKLGLFPRSTGQLLDTRESLHQVCQITRLYTLDLALKSALSMLVTDAPDWLLAHISPHWYERYSSRRFSPASAAFPGGLETIANRLGTDIHHLLEAIDQDDSGMLSLKPEIMDLVNLSKNLFIREENEFTLFPIQCEDCTLYGTQTSRGIPG